MKFTDSSAVEQVVWQLKLSDWPRAVNRALVNDLFNGFPPYSEDDVKDSQIITNVNDLTASKIAHDARRQMSQAFLVPDPLFTVTVDYGAAFKRHDWGQIITRQANKIIKESLFFFETQRSGIAQNVLHGVAPSSWSDDVSWCPRSDGIEDILVPSNTLCSLENLPFFAKFRSYTARELWSATHGAQVDPGWNIPLVESACRWVDQQGQALLGNSWPEVWSPEKMEERVKQDGGLYASDSVPTVDVYDFYYWDNSGKREGWRRKMILDAWGFPGAGGAINDIKDIKTDRSRYGMEKSQFLYDSEQRENPVYADKLEHIIHFQFADCSSVAPFRYHSVRALGWLLYAPCVLQNKLGCKINDSLFESLMQYFRVNNLADAERALKIDLTDKRPLPDGIQFVRPEERWQVNENLIKMVMGMNREKISENSENFIHAFDTERSDSETATRTMAKASNSASMVSAMLGQAYIYKTQQYREIMRRLCLPVEKSKNVDANRFRTQCLKQGVPAEALEIGCLTITPTKIIAGGNKMLQIAMMDKIMAQYYMKLDPSAQREVLQMGISVTTDDYDLARRWVPEQPQVSGSRHDAQLSAGLMLSGLPMDFKQGVNHDEYVEALLISMAAKIQQIQAMQKPIEPDELLGLQNIAGQSLQGQPVKGNGIMSHIKILESHLQHNIKGHPDEKTQKQKVKGYMDAFGKLMNQVKAMAQQAAEAAKKQQSQGQQQQLDPKDQAKIQGIITLAQTKAKLAQESHAQRTAQRQIQWELQQKQRESQHAQDVVHEHRQNTQDLIHEHQSHQIKTLSE